MLGLADFGVTRVFVLTRGSAALCVAYGLINWNQPGVQQQRAEIAEEAAWERDETQGRTR